MHATKLGEKTADLKKLRTKNVQEMAIKFGKSPLFFCFQDPQKSTGCAVDNMHYVSVKNSSRYFNFTCFIV